MSKRKFNPNIIPLLFIILIDALGFGIVFPTLTPLLVNNTTGIFAPDISIQTRNFWFECTIGIYCIFMFLNAPVLGSLSDRYGRKIILLLSMAGCTLGFAVSAMGVVLNNLICIIAGRIISGATAGSFPIAQAALLDDVKTDAEKTSRLGLLVLANGIGFSCGPVIGSLLMDKNIWHTQHYQLPFWFATALAFIGMLTLQFVFKESFRGNPLQRISFLTSFYNLKEAFTLTKTRSYCSTLVLFMLSYVIFFTTLPIFITFQFHKSGAWIGYFLTYFGVIFTIGLLILFPRVVKQFKLSTIVCTSLIIQCGFYFLFTLISHLMGLWFMAIPIAIVVPFAYVGLVNLLSNSVSDQEQGKFMGVAGSIAAFAWGAGPLLTGALGKVTFLAPFYGAFGLSLLASIFWVAGILKIRSSQQVSAK